MAKRNSNQRALPYFVLAIIFFIVVCALYVHEDNEDGKIIRSYTSYPRITTQEELIEAFNGPAANYAVEGLALSGTPVNDGLKILTDEYLILNYDCHLLTKSLARGSDGYTILQGKWVITPAKCWTSISDEILLAEGIGLDKNEVTFEYGGYGTMDETNCVETAWEQLENGFYYPDGMELNEGDRRYVMRGVKVGDKATFAATIGDGKLDVLPVADGDMVLINGTVEQLVGFVYSQNDAMTRLLIILVLSFDLVFWGMGIRCCIKKLKKGKKRSSDADE